MYFKILEINLNLTFIIKGSLVNVFWGEDIEVVAVEGILRCQNDWLYLEESLCVRITR